MDLQCPQRDIYPLFLSSFISINSLLKCYLVHDQQDQLVSSAHLQIIFYIRPAEIVIDQNAP